MYDWKKKEFMVSRDVDLIEHVFPMGLSNGDMVTSEVVSTKDFYDDDFDE